MMTLNCGEPDYTDIPSSILQGYEEKILVLPPNLFDYWADYCDVAIEFLNDPPLDFLSFSDGELSLFPSGCTTPD